MINFGVWRFQLLLGTPGPYPARPNGPKPAARLLGSASRLCALRCFLRKAPLPGLSSARWGKPLRESRTMEKGGRGEKGVVKPAASFGGGMPNENDTKQRSRDCPSGGGGAQVVIRKMPLEDRCPLVAVETKKINLSPPGLQLGIPASLWDFPKSSWRGRRDGAPTNTNPTGGSRPSCAQAFGVLGRFGVPPSSPSRAPASPPSPFGIFGLGV